MAQDKLKNLENFDPIPISDIKTTHLIFKDKIKYLDLGSRYFLSDSIGTIIKVKHLGEPYTEKEEQKESNLTVITQNDDYYSIPLYFKRNIKTTSYQIGKTSNSIRSDVSGDNGLDQSLLYEICSSSTKTRSNQDIRGKRSLILAKISGIFYRENYMIIRAEIKNFSNIDLDIDHILFRFIKKKRIGRKDFVYQERVLHPVKICNSKTRVDRSGGIEVYTFIFKKFTPNQDEKLQVDILEKEGGRSTTIPIPKKKLLTPKVI